MKKSLFSSFSCILARSVHIKTEAAADLQIKITKNILVNGSLTLAVSVKNKITNFLFNSASTLCFADFLATAGLYSKQKPSLNFPNNRTKPFSN
ncbi:MAG: hypothetical protein IJ752_07595 [Alphaproteobacteria bacterium]|nr:hypothetical protein [Alphaproteobacteria bacterium]